MGATHNETLPDQAELRLTGELDLGTGVDTMDTICRAIANGPRSVALDLHEVSFIDCSGLAPILVARRDGGERGCSVWIARTSFAVHRLLDLTGLMALTVPPDVRSR